MSLKVYLATTRLRSVHGLLESLPLAVMAQVSAMEVAFWPPTCTMAWVCLVLSF